MILKFESKCVLEVEHTEGAKTTKHLATKFNLEVSENLDKSQYIDADGVPTAAGTKVLTNNFVQGLIGNIHQAHDKGYWDSAEHLRYIIAELERGFIAVTNSDTSNF